MGFCTDPRYDLPKAPACARAILASFSVCFAEFGLPSSFSHVGPFSDYCFLWLLICIILGLAYSICALRNTKAKMGSNRAVVVEELESGEKGAQLVPRQRRTVTKIDNQTRVLARQVRSLDSTVPAKLPIQHRYVERSPSKTTSRSSYLDEGR